jgi:hypothetical protein
VEILAQVVALMQMVEALIQQADYLQQIKQDLLIFVQAVAVAVAVAVQSLVPYQTVALVQQQVEQMVDKEDRFLEELLLEELPQQVQAVAVAAAVAEEEPLPTML